MKILLAIPFLESLDGPQKLYTELQERGIHKGGYIYEYKSHIVNVVFRRNTTICDARNKFGQEAVKHGYDYLAFNDSDIEGSLDDLIKLVESGKNIIGGGYEEHTSKCLQVWDLKRGKADKKYRYGDRSGPVKVDGIATGFMCINVKNVLKKMEYPWFHRSKYMGEIPTDDFWFCLDALKAGFDIFWDSDIRLKHFKRDITTTKKYIDTLLTQTKEGNMKKRYEIELSGIDKAIEGFTDVSTYRELEIKVLSTFFESAASIVKDRKKIAVCLDTADRVENVGETEKLIIDEEDLTFIDMIIKDGSPRNPAWSKCRNLFKQLANPTPETQPEKTEDQ